MAMPAPFVPVDTKYIISRGLNGPTLAEGRPKQKYDLTCTYLPVTIKLNRDDSRIDLSRKVAYPIFHLFTRREQPNDDLERSLVRRTRYQ